MTYIRATHTDQKILSRGEHMEASEKETIISWNDAEDSINIFTCHKKIMARMEKLGVTVKDKCVLNGKLRHVEYQIPKDKITVSLIAKRRGTATQIESLKKARLLSPIGKKLLSQKEPSIT